MAGEKDADALDVAAANRTAANRAAAAALNAVVARADVDSAVPVVAERDLVGQASTSHKKCRRRKRKKILEKGNDVAVVVR